MDTTNKKIGTIGRKDGDKVNHQSISSENQDSESTTKVLYVGLLGGAFLIVCSASFLGYKYVIGNDNNVAQIKDPIQVKQVKKAEVNELLEEPQKPSINFDPKNRDEQYQLAMRYLNGDQVNKDYQEAIKWFGYAASQEHKNSQAMLGKIYYYGEFSKPDFKKALMWNTLAAAQGVKEAQYILGLMYEQGDGVQQDLKEARKWFDLAAAQGLEDAKNKISISEKIKEEKIIEVKKPSKIVNQDDLSEVNKYLSRVEKDRNKAPTITPQKDREIIWN
jgi:hypothetical protein